VNEVELNKVSKEIFGITSRHYRRLAEEGHVPSTVRGKIGLLESVKALLVYYREKAEKTDSSIESEKVLKFAVERKLKELQLAIRSGDLILKADIARMISEREKAVKRGLSLLHLALVKKLVGKDSREMGGIIKNEVCHFLNRMGRMRVN
jgi:hypothetical protein